MLSTTRLTHVRSADWQAPLAVVGAVSAGFIGAKILRQAVIWAQFTLMPPEINKFKGEWALITGGSEGVGKAVAAELAKHGLHVFLVSRSQAKLDAAADELTKKYPTIQVRTYSADLTDPSSYRELLQYLTITKTHISVLVANAGGIPNSHNAINPYWQFSEVDESQIMNLNGQACYSLVRGLLPAMISDRKGAVVCISSLASRVTAYMAPYGAEKAKMNALCDALDIELHGTGVTAQAMVLGMVITPAIHRFMQAGSAAGSSSSSSSPEAAAADAAPVLKPGVFVASAEAAAAAIVKHIGRGGAVVTPYWGHALSQWIVFGWWPPELQRFITRTFARRYKDKAEQRQKNPS